MPEYTMESGGKSYTFSSDSPLSDADLQAAASQYFGPEQSTASKIGGIVGEELAKTPGRMVEGVKSGASDLWESIKNPKLGTILPMTLGPGGGAATSLGQGVAQGLARATATGVGRAVDAPQGQKIEQGLKGGGLAAAWEAALGAAPYLRIPYLTRSLNQVAEPLAGRERAFTSAGQAPMAAYERLRGSVPEGAWMQVPSISPNPITFEEASRGLSRLQGVDWTAARNEIFSELQRGGTGHAFLTGPPLNPPVRAAQALTTAPRQPYAAEGFNIRVPGERFTPPSTEAERFATGAIQGLQSPITRTAADTVAPEQGPGGVPVGAWPGILAKTALQHYAPRWLGGGR